MSDLVLPSDAAIAALCNGIYDYPGYAPVVWDHLELPEQDNGICWGVKQFGGVDVIVLRGSTTQQDWIRDFAALADPFTGAESAFLKVLAFKISGAPSDHAFLGPVHPGFLAGMEDAWAAMKPLIGSRVIVSGHSLGAGRAAILTGLMVHDGRPPLARVVFGEPRPGFPPLAKLISSVTARSYRNGNGVLYDLVTDVPMPIGPEDYVHPCPLTDVCEEPGPKWTEQWGVFAWHAMPLYLRAAEKREGLSASGPVDLAPHERAPVLPIH